MTFNPVTLEQAQILKNGDCPEFDANEYCKKGRKRMGKTGSVPNLTILRIYLLIRKIINL